MTQRPSDEPQNDCEPAEVDLGGAFTQVHRVGDTVRRERRANATTVHALLNHLEAAGFDGAPRYLGIDDQGREIFSFIPGECVRYENNASIPDTAYGPLGALIRRFHGASRGFRSNGLAGPGFVWGHGDIGPSNVVFRAGVPVALIDFDYARPLPVQREIAWDAWQSVPLADPDTLELMGFSAAPDYMGRIKALLNGYGYRADLRAQFAEDAAAAAHECAVNISPGMVLPAVVDSASAIGICLRQEEWMLDHAHEINAAAAG